MEIKIPPEIKKYFTEDKDTYTVILKDEIAGSLCFAACKAKMPLGKYFTCLMREELVGNNEPVNFGDLVSRIIKSIKTTQ